MMFGPMYRIETEKVALTLRPFCLEDLPEVARGFSKPLVIQYTMQMFGVTVENERKWYDSMMDDSENIVWAITMDGQPFPIGSTGLHRMNMANQAAHTCISGIVIWRDDLWGQGVASVAHIARTAYALNTLDRFTILSHVKSPNIASRKALERVGYIHTGKSLRDSVHNGEFEDTDHFSLVNPRYVDRLFPEGLPDEYKPGVERVKETLEKAKVMVKPL